MAAIITVVPWRGIHAFPVRTNRDGCFVIAHQLHQQPCAMPAIPVHPPLPLKITPKDKLPRGLDAAIRELKKILGEIPDKATRQYDILDFIKERTDADRVLLQLTNPLGRCIGSMFWPVPEAWMWPKLAELGPAYWSLGVCDEIWEYGWNTKLGKAYIMPPHIWRKSPAYDLVFHPIGNNHVIVAPIAYRDNGNHLFVAPTRSNVIREERLPKYSRRTNISRDDETYIFRDSDCEKLEKICHEFREDLGSRDPEGELAPLRPEKVIETLTLDANLLPAQIDSSYALAMIGRFFGPLRHDNRGRLRLPAPMEEAIRRGRDESRAKHAVSPPALLPIEFSGKYLGRILKGDGDLLQDGTMTICIKEDTEHHENLRRMILECRKFSQARAKVLFKICLLIQEGVNTREELTARLSRHPSLKDEKSLKADIKTALRIAHPKIE